MSADETEKLMFSAEDTCFRGVVTFLMALQGFVCAATAYNSDGRPAAPSPNDLMTFDAALSSTELDFKPYDLAKTMMSNRWPTIVEFSVRAVPAVSRRRSPQWGIVDRFLFCLGQSLIGNFFEEQRSQIQAHYGSVSSWPPVWNFARVLRNAMSHNGKIAIKDNTVVGWKGLSYTAADNGREIANYDIFPGDLFYLLREMEAAIPPQIPIGRRSRE